MWLTYTINMQDFGVHRFHVDLLKMSQITVISPTIYSHEMLHCMQFSAYVLQVFPYTFHRTCLHVSLYMFSVISDWNSNCKGVKLPSGCVVPRSRSFHTFGCCFVNCRGGADEVDHFRLSGPPGLSTMPGWYYCVVVNYTEFNSLPVQIPKVV